ncbi:MAG TPA: asparagine synthase (glutamine-hydrolyzing) [Vicinamibacterales bacterium]|nr:asparagine synthase (glutamine-hydrolyzing) [Vicinamibacterales bacterium]
MCGFVAILQNAPVVSVATARRALETIAHRGPDATGEWYERDVFLGHRRLSIIDLTTGDQPMHSVDGRYVIVFNGEIYNFLELRKLLVEGGASFRTQSDTEVIVEGYRRWGAGVVDRLHGMFAFVIWDRLRSSAFAARDRLGIKPLCWAVHRGALIISSTLEPLGALDVFRQIDLIGVRDLMTFDYIPAPRTIRVGVRKLDPGSRFEWASGADTPAIERYWRPPPVNRASSAPDEWELEALLESAVKRQMISDVPIGAFLSGGVDSSLLAALMMRHSGRPVRTFSVAFAEHDLDESPIAELVARRFGTDHTVLRAEAPGPAALLELLGRLDEPFCDPAFVPTHALSELTRHHVKVALCGDGGDEVFGGYQKYLLGEVERRPLPLSSVLDRSLRAVRWRPRGVAPVYWRLLSSQDRIRFAWARHGDFPVFRKDIRQLLAPAYQDAAEVAAYFDPWEQRALRHGRRFDTDVLMRTDVETYLSENCLVKTDRASMLASLEVRVPYLDEKVLDRILPLPVQAKIPSGQLKALLMPIARRLLPREVWDRPKQGFGGPLDVWLAGVWRPAVDTVLDWGESNLALFDYRYLRRLHAINIGAGGCGRALWNPFVFLAWAKAHSVTV